MTKAGWSIISGDSCTVLQSLYTFCVGKLCKQKDGATTSELVGNIPESGAEHSRLFHGWSNVIIYDISVEQNFPELSLEHSRTDDIIMTSFLSTNICRSICGVL
jgi:hypothetical protein